MEEQVYVILYDYINKDGSTTKRMFDATEPSIEYLLSVYMGGVIEIFTN